jgi:hypothetical protein
MTWIEWIVGGYEVMQEKKRLESEERQRAHLAARLDALTRGRA